MAGYDGCLLVLMLLLGLSACNMWDNVYSQAYASTPIVLSQSLNIDFKVAQYQLDANIDYNNDKQLVTLAYYFDLLLTKLEVMKIQIDLNTLTLSQVRVGKMGCQKFKLAALADRKMDVGKVSKENLFLINILFKYVGRDRSNGKQWEKYKFDPFLFSSPEKALDRAKKELEKNVKDTEIDEELDNLDLDLQLNLFVSVDSKTGYVKRISEGKHEREVPFELTSHVKNPMICEAEAKVLTNEDIKKMGEFIVKNRGNYEKLIEGNIHYL